MEYVKSEAKHSKTAYRALTFSGVSFLSAVLGIPFLTLILSPIAMIFSHLSKGRLKTRHFAAQAASVIAVLAILLNIAMVGFTVYRYQTDPAVRNKVNSIMESYYGMSMDEYTEMLINETRITLPGQQSE